MKRKSPIDKACDVQRETLKTLLVAAGGQRELATKLGVSQAAVSKWLMQGYVPLRRAVEIEAVYGVHRTRTANPRIVQALSSVESMFTPA